MDSSIEKYLSHLEQTIDESTKAIESMKEVLLRFPDVKIRFDGHKFNEITSDLVTKEVDRFTTSSGYGCCKLHPYVVVGNLRIYSRPSAFYYGNGGYEEYYMPNFENLEFSQTFKEKVQEFIDGLNERLEQSTKQEKLEELRSLAEELNVKIVEE